MAYELFHSLLTFRKQESCILYLFNLYFDEEVTIKGKQMTILP